MDMSLITQITQQTGQVPAILECDYANGFWSTIPPQNLLDYSCNSVLKNHWNKDGLVNVCTHFPNPVSPNGGELRNKSNLVFNDLLNPQTITGQRWYSFLDIVADGFKELQESNVTVMYRPFHEMNGGWFWWGTQVRKISY
jgi:mannan endo-1,4-beta-mannosidase